MVTKKSAPRRVPRKVTKKRGRSEEIVGYRPRVVVKFHDQVQLPYEDGVEKTIQRLHLGPWERMEKAFPGITFKRLYTSLAPEKIRALVDRATEIDREYKPSNLLGYFVVDCPPGVDPEVLVKELRAWPMVKTAYYDPPGDDPVVNPADDPRSGNQGYLDPAPDGIDAEFAWGFTGGDGAGISVIDMERGWTLNHEDLTAHGAALLHGVLLDSSRPHGTSVLGEICAVDNALGCVGICPNISSVNVVSYNGSTRPDAMMAAIDALSFGDVLLLEAQLSITGWSNMPIEVLDAEFDTIRLASALGIVVVEAAGNGSNDLDTYANGSGDMIFNRGSAGFRDSGAIMVGAGSSSTPHTRLGFSNFGSRVDCYGWGENVDTCSSTSGGSQTSYTSSFNGTSSASPIVTGAALALQGIAEASLSSRFSPKQMRDILSDPATGTASDDPPVDRIGVMPDLRAIIEDVLNVATDVYIRDFVGDTGDTHTGPISASPDIILLPSAVADPQASFGEGSGTENSSVLGFEAEAGQDNFIYVRVRNRGGSPAANVVATIYWSPPATLVTPDLWTLVDSINIGNVPEGDILTVSDAITWPSAAIPGEGHYCFVGLVGTADEPAPDPADFGAWANFQRFISENNNVTWRNFNVVNNDPSAGGGDPADFVALPFLAPGAPDKARRMALEIVAKLPRGSRVLLEAPLHFIDALQVRAPFLKAENKKGTVRVPINPYGRQSFEEMLFPAKSRTKLRLLVQIPKASRRNQYEVYARQLYKGREVGRITWRLVPPEFLKERRQALGKQYR